MNRAPFNRVLANLLVVAAFAAVFALGDPDAPSWQEWLMMLVVGSLVWGSLHIYHQRQDLLPSGRARCVVCGTPTLASPDDEAVYEPAVVRLPSRMPLSPGARSGKPDLGNRRHVNGDYLR